MPTDVEKIEAHAGHLLDAFIALKQRYAMLEPMLYDEVVVNARGTGSKYRGFATLRYSLFLSCVQDIAKLTLDKSEKAPSIYRLMNSLERDELKATLRERYSNWKAPFIDEETDPEVLEALRAFELGEVLNRGMQFDSLYAEAKECWASLSDDRVMVQFKAVRDTVSAHLEIRYVADKYVPGDISSLGVKWSDVSHSIDAMQRLVALLGQIIRNAGFAWDSLNEQLTKASKSFWT